MSSSLQPPSRPAAGSAPAGRVALRDLPSSPEIAARLEEERRRLGRATPALWRWIVEELKLQYYYGGRHVIYVDTPMGRVVVGAGVPGEGVLRRILDGLSDEERD